MENNTFLGDSLVAVYHANKAEITTDGLTGTDIAIYIKTSHDISLLNTVKLISQSDIFDNTKSVLLRVASECQFGVFGDSHCDCESQRTACLEAINSHGQGIYIQLPQEGQGRGLHYKAKELQLQVQGINPSGQFIGKKDIYEASKILTGSDNVDVRNFTTLKKIFNQLNLTKYDYVLVSANPQKSQSLADEVGISILGSRDVKRALSLDNVGEYLAKIYKKNFRISDEDLREVYNILFQAKSIPERVSSLIRYIEDDMKAGRIFNANESYLQKITLLVTSKVSRNPLNKLDRSSMYLEYQVEIAVTDDDVRHLIKKGLLNGISDFAFEQNYFYDLVYLKNNVARDLKIRRKSTVDKDRTLLESRLIYKIPVGTNAFKIKNIAINDREVADLLANSLEGYEVYYVPVFTHTCLHPFGSAITILVKRYSSEMKSISIMGKKSAVAGILVSFEEVIKVTAVPDPTHIRTLNHDLSLNFDYEDIARQESDFYDELRKVAQ